jgi:hypothetical protein
MGAVQITEKWLATNQGKPVEACFTMTDSRIGFNKLHRLIDAAIREMPQPLRISFEAPLKATAPKVAAPSVPAPAPVAPAPPPEPPLKLTPMKIEEEEEPEIIEDSVEDSVSAILDEDEDEDDEDDEPPPKTKMAPFEPELVEIRPLANYFDGPNFASATKRPAPVVVTTGVKKRGRPRKNPLL